MKTISLYISIVFLLLLQACETDLLRTTIQDGTDPVLSSSATQVVLAKGDSANVAFKLTWTNPNYLDDTSNGNVVGLYEIELAKTQWFTNPNVIKLGNVLEASFNVYKFNTMLLDLNYEAGKASDLYIRVKSIFFSSDTMVSNVLKLSVTPYTTVIPPAIAVPAELFICGDAIPAGWATPFPANQKFTKETATVFTITIDLLGNKAYELVADGTGANWTPCYRLDPAIDPATVVNGGTFVWDGNGSAYGWGSKKFLTPDKDGTYKLTFNFQNATFKVEDVTGPPAIAVPEQLWIYGDGLNGGWVTPFPAERQFTKVSATVFSVTIFIKAGTDYEMITDGTGANWTPCYRINPALDRTTMIWDGTFVWDGDGSAYSWGSKKFLSPPDDGTYKITMDFQTASYRVVKQ